MNRHVIFSALAATTLAVEAKVLQEPLVVCQAEFYPTREQDRGYLGRYPDLPLFVLKDLPPAEREIAPTRKRSFWGDYTSMADVNSMYEEARRYGMDGFAFFPVEHRSDIWNAQYTSVPGLCLTPIINFLPGNGANKSTEQEIVQVKNALANRRAPMVRGKPLILSYWTDRGNTPEQLKEKLDAARAACGGDKFVFMCATSWDHYRVEFRANGGFLTAAEQEKMKAYFRSYLRVCDGLLLDGTMGNHAIEHQSRIFAGAYHKAVCRLARETVDEPEFKDKKLLGFTLSLGHQNAYHQSFTANAMGTRTLRQSFANVLSADPDVILIPEWDECNESTSWKPTLYNGFTTKRLYRYFDAQLRHKPLTVMEGDDTSMPNLMISYRRTLSPGEWLYFEVVNVPDGARQGKVEVALELTDADGRVLMSLPARPLDETKLDEAWWDVHSDELAEKARAIGVRLKWKCGAVRHGTVDEGLAPIDIAPANSWCLKDVKQALRDLAPVSDASLALKDNGKLAAKIACDEPILHAMLVGDNWIEYIHNPKDAVSAFREDDDNAVFAIVPYAPLRAGTDLRQKDFVLSVDGASDVSWSYVNDIVHGPAFHDDLLGPSCPPIYLRIPKSALASARLKIDYGTFCQGEVGLNRAYKCRSYALGSTNGVSFAIVKFQRQCRYPLPLREKTCSFEVQPDESRLSAVHYMQLVTMSGKTWRSHPIVIEPKDKTVKTRVWSALKAQAVDCYLPAARVPLLKYNFGPTAGDVVTVRSGERRFFGGRGTPCSMTAFWNRGAGIEGAFGGDGVVPPSGDCHPQRERQDDGSWAFVFDGIDDYVDFPWETMPQWAGVTVSLDVMPAEEGMDAQQMILAARQGNRQGMFSIQLDRGELVIFADVVDPFHSSSAESIRTGLKLEAGCWNNVKVAHDGASVRVTVNGATAQRAIKMPGTFMTAMTLGSTSTPTCRNYKGKLRNLIIDHAVEGTR